MSTGQPSPHDQVDGSGAYSFCESIHATGTSPWHLRKLDETGRHLGGGITTHSLCGLVERGWDLEVKITRHHLNTNTCRRCREALQQQIKF